MNKAFGIITSSNRDIWVSGLQDYRPIGAFSFLGRYRVVDFAISNLTNSGIERIQLYTSNKPRSLVEHVGTGRHYNINSKSGKLQLLFSGDCDARSLYNTDLGALKNNVECIERMKEDYCVITPSYMVFTEDYSNLLNTHIESGADITLLYHSVNNAKERYLNCNVIQLNRQKGVLSITRNQGTAQNRHVFMDTYILSKTLLLEIINISKKVSSMYTLSDMVNAKCEELDVRGVSHKGYFASITDFRSYYNANLDLVNYYEANNLFKENWPIYTRTNDSCPTKYFKTADVKTSVISNGCIIKGKIENSIIGRGCNIEEGAVIKNSVILSGTRVGKNCVIENQVVDKKAKIVNVKSIISPKDDPGYICRGDIV